MPSSRGRDSSENMIVHFYDGRWHVYQFDSRPQVPCCDETTHKERAVVESLRYKLSHQASKNNGESTFKDGPMPCRRAWRKLEHFICCPLSEY